MNKMVLGKLVASVAAAVVVGSVLFAFALHRPPGPDCILLRYFVNEVPERPYRYFLTCPEGIVSGWSWDEVAANYKQRTDPMPYDYERVWRP